LSSRIETVGLDDLAEGVATPVEVEGRSVVLVRWRDRVFAVRNICPHQAASFAGGFVHSGLTGAAGPTAVDFVVDDDEPVLQCPRHHWEFRPRDGSCVADPRFRVRSYETVVEDGRVFVIVSAR